MSEPIEREAQPASTPQPSSSDVRTGGLPKEAAGAVASSKSKRAARAPRIRLVVGTVMLVAGLVLSAAGVSGDGTPAPSVSANLPVNEGATSAVDIRAHNSPTVVQSPRNRAVLAEVNRIDSPRFSCALHISIDGAASWIPEPLPFPAGEEDPPRCYAPDAAFDSRGTLYVSFVTLKGAGNTPNALWVTSSTDDAQTFSEPVRVTGPLAFQARLVADPETPGRLFVSWLQAGATGNLLFPEAGNPIVLSRSDDAGRSWQPPVQISPPSRQRVVAPSVAVGRGNDVLVSYLDLGDDVLDYHGAHEGRGGDPYGGKWSLVVARSVDGGATWQESVADDALVPTERFVVFIPPVPSLAVDRRSGRVYVGFQDGREGSADVRVWTSRDGGRTFGPGLRVNDTSPDDRTTQYRPEVAVAPNGRLDVLYYDRRDDPDDVFNATSLQSSTDGGRTFSRRVKVSEKAFDSRIGSGSLRGMPDLGSRLAVVSMDDRALAVWTDTRSGTDVTNKQDIAQAIVTFGEANSTPDVLRVAGVGVALVGLAIAVITVVGIRRREPR